MCIGIHTYIQNRHNIKKNNRAATLKKLCVYVCGKKKGGGGGGVEMHMGLGI